ncbi:ABC transporter permease [[Clostridium] hylemonae]|uniref:ABC transporter, permease protein n=1 Tax=[Clostridium] hylemonae DSM 15053 TaxID=553973 RepID=C0BZ91_9FIRM|nr:ABC transporter permease [[Clostridium] hylemonae]EEG74469.1 ABC transporter, permease protein [[Clostridium] hylemonae DSM 15053]QEK18506.1 Dipeptide transport system permease protein DppB [[Clostridium] hylemonae DSM 15053]
MGRYTRRRILLGILALFVLVTAAFFLTRMIPGSPFQSGNVSESVLRSLEREYGLDKPAGGQYVTYLGNLLRGDLGMSYKKPGTSVAEVIARAWPVTFFLGFLAILLAVVLGTVMGVWQAVTERKAVKGGIFLGTMLGTGMPNFVIALLLALLFGVKLKFLPVAGLTGAANYVLPVVSLAVYPASVITRMIHNAAEEEMKRDYVVMARAKGLGRRRILFMHVLKNAWLPVLNYIGPAAAFLLTGSFVTESIFTIPGLGREFVTSIANRDYTLILGLTVFMGTVVIGINLITDLVGAWLDPRVRRTCR